MGDEGQPKKRGKKGGLQQFATAMFEVHVALTGAVLAELMSREAVDTALAKARRDEGVEAALAAALAAAGGGKLPKPGKPRGTRAASPYNLFVSVVLHALREAGKESSLTIASGTWANLPPDTKAAITERFTRLAEELKSAAGGDAAKQDPAEELARLEAAAGLAPFDYLALVAAHAPPPGTVSKSAAARAAKRAATDAATAATAADGEHHQHHKKHKKDKEHKKDKRDKEHKKAKKDKKEKKKKAKEQQE